jgi:superfamily II DNA/RNA helicase
MNTFADLGVRPRTLAALTSQRIIQPLPVQERCIPSLLAGRDAVIQAPTGSGKTLAFVVPLLERLGSHRRDGPRALIVAPTRELVAQIVGVTRGLDPSLRTAMLIGGVGYGPQLAALSSDPDVVVGCPGRILDLAARGSVHFSAVQVLILDEADEMLDQGFARDIERIIALTPQTRGPQVRQTVLASATMPEWVQRMVQRHLLEPVRVAVAGDQLPLLEHGLVHISRGDRLRILSDLLGRQTGSAIVFHRTKHGVRKLSRDLARLGHRSTELQGNLSQNARDRAIADFRSLQRDVLVATNVAARGLDIDHVRLVVNYELPESARWLTHRIGRTARNGARGRALTFLADDDLEQWGKLRRDGAPDLPWVDLEALVATGVLQGAAAPVGAAAAPRAISRTAGRPAVRRITPRVGSRPLGAHRPRRASIHPAPAGAGKATVNSARDGARP